MLVVLHFHDRDGALALEDLRWAHELDGTVDYEILLAYDETTNGALVTQARELAGKVFSKVHELCYPPSSVRGWPAAPNWAFQSVARYVPTAFKSHWFWWEPDAIPLKPGWIKALDAEYQRAGQPLMGHVVHGVVPHSHVNGCAVYCNDVATISVRAFMCQNAAWDVVMAEETQACRHDAWRLIAHVWGIHEGKGHHTCGEAPVFKELQNVYDWVDLDAVIFHRCKDESLIKWLRHMRSAEFNVPKLTVAEETQDALDFQVLFGHPDGYPFTEIFIVTYHKDLPWLEYCLRSIYKFCSGFNGVTLVVPSKEYRAFKNFEIGNTKVITFDERPSKGMLHHMAIECMADQFAPKGVECVLHLDADTIFNGSTDLSKFFRNGKPIYVWRTYDSLYDPERKVNSDCVIWKERTEKALGFKTNVYGMCVMPCINDLRLFPEFRKWIEATHKMPFLDWATSGRNEFPQDWSEYSALGAFAKELMPELYHWLDCAVEPVPKENSFHFHSHSGLTPQIREQIEGWLK